MHDKTIRRRRAVLALLVVLSLILLTDYFGESPNSPLHSVQRTIVEVLSPVQAGASKVLSPVRDLAGWVSSTLQAKSNNARLVATNATLTKEVGQYKYDAIEFARDQQLLKLDASAGLSQYDPLTANVTGRDPALWYQHIEIDAGSDAGVAQDDPVVGGDGLVGEITEVGSDESEVTLLTDPNFAAGAMIEDTDGQGTTGVQGYSGVLQPAVGNPNSLVLSTLPTTTPINQLQEEVVTSGFQDPADHAIQSYFPPGIPIGFVSNTNAATTVETSGEVDVTPYVNVSQLSAVQVLTKPHAKS